MMVIFDRFRSVQKAQQFAGVAAAIVPEEKPIICRNHEEFDKHEIFPCEVRFPAVLVHRTEWSLEDALENIVGRFGGRFAGT